MVQVQKQITNLTETELKALAFDQREQLDTISRNLQIIRKEILSRVSSIEKQTLNNTTTENNGLQQ